MWEPHPALRTPFCELVGVDYPIVQTGMGWVATPELTAFDLMGYPRHAGGLGNAATVMQELADELDPRALADVAESRHSPGLSASVSSSSWSAPETSPRYWLSGSQLVPQPSARSTLPDPAMSIREMPAGSSS